MILHNYHQLNYYQKKKQNKQTKNHKTIQRNMGWGGGTNLVHKEKLTKTQEKTFCNLF